MDNDLNFSYDWDLPTVRIKSAALTDFRDVGYGKIVFNCGRKYVPSGTEADILGLYGQNGSGKSSFIEALDLLRGLMSGYSVPKGYADCIALNKEFAKMEFVFDLQYDSGEIRTAQYSFCIRKQLLSEEEIKEEYRDRPNSFETPKEEFRVIVFNEKFSLAWENSKKMQVIIDTSSDEVPFVPDTKRKILAGSNKNSLVPLEINKRLATDKSRSFIFMKDTIRLFAENAKGSLFFQVLAELQFFATNYLYVITTNPIGFISFSYGIIIHLRKGNVIFDARNPVRIKDIDMDFIRKQIEKISDVISQIIPGLTISLKEISQTVTSKGEDATNVMLMSNRNELEMPLRDESDGIQRLISVLCLIIDVFNEKSLTLAIDEFDSGIYEYLLGEILQAMEASGKGQFIFTSHNLRPLEVINNKFLYFTTTNPQNRYVRLSHIAETNNLRDTYFREIVLNEQKEEMYKRVKTYKIVAAIKKAGEIK